MKKNFLFFGALFLAMCFAFSANAAPRHSIDFSGKKIIVLSVLPYINVSGEESNYVLDSLKAGYTDYFANSGFKVAPLEDTQAAMAKAEYSAEDNIIASEENLKSIAQNSDFAIALEIEEISTLRYDEFPKTKITAKIKLLYKIYRKSDDKVYQFRITTTKDNKATLADVGPKYAVKPALDQALERGNHRLTEIINGQN